MLPAALRRYFRSPQEDSGIPDLDYSSKSVSAAVTRIDRGMSIEEMKRLVFCSVARNVASTKLNDKEKTLLTHVSPCKKRLESFMGEQMALQRQEKALEPLTCCRYELHKYKISEWAEPFKSKAITPLIEGNEQKTELAAISSKQPDFLKAFGVKSSIALLFALVNKLKPASEADSSVNDVLLAIQSVLDQTDFTITSTQDSEYLDDIILYVYSCCDETNLEIAIGLLCALIARRRTLQSLITLILFLRKQKLDFKITTVHVLPLIDSLQQTLNDTLNGDLANSMNVEQSFIDSSKLTITLIELIDIVVGLMKQISSLVAPSLNETNEFEPMVYGEGKGNGLIQSSDSKELVRQGKPMEQENIIQLCTGENFTLKLDSNGNLFSKGSWKRKYHAKFTQVNDSSNPFIKVSPSTHSSVTGIAIDENGHLWHWENSQNTNFQLVETPDENLKFIEIACTNSAKFAVSTGGHCYSCGSGYLGINFAEGRSSANKLQKVPIPFVHVENVFCGFQFTFILGDSGQSVYGWGENLMGQLGGDREIYKVPHRIKSLCNKGITQIACGFSHSIALSSNGTVYSSGTFGTFTSSFQHTEVHGLPKIDFIAAGWKKSFAVSQHGVVYFWGLRGNEDIETPTVLPSVDNFKVSQISCCHKSHTLFYNFPTAKHCAVPYVLDLKEQSIFALTDLLGDVFTHFEDCDASVNLLECLLYVLHANLCSMKRTNSYAAWLSSWKLQELLFRILRSEIVPPESKHLAKQFFVVHLVDLVRSVENKLKFLFSFLQSALQRPLVVSDWEIDLFNSITLSVIKTNRFSSFMLNSEKEALDLFILLVSCAEVAAITMINKEEFCAYYESLKELLVYLYQPLVADLVDESNENDSANSLGIRSTLLLLSSSQSIVTSLTDSSSKILMLTHMASIIPFAITICHSFSHETLTVLYEPLKELLLCLNKAINLYYHDIIPQLEKQEFKEENSRLSEENLLIDLQRQIASLLGLFYSTILFPHINETEEWYKVANLPFIEQNEIQMKTADLHPFLLSLVNLEPNTLPFRSAITSKARKQLWLFGYDNNSCVHSLVSLLISIVLKLLELEQTAEESNKKEPGEILKAFPASFFSWLENIFEFRRQLVSAALQELGANENDSLTSDDPSITSVCTPVIYRAQFVLFHLQMKPSQVIQKQNNDPIASIDDYLLDKVFTFIQSPTEETIITKMLENASSVGYSRISSLHELATLLELQENKLIPSVRSVLLLNTFHMKNFTGTGFFGDICGVYPFFQLIPIELKKKIKHEVGAVSGSLVKFASEFLNSTEKLSVAEESILSSLLRVLSSSIVMLNIPSQAISDLMEFLIDFYSCEKYEHFDNYLISSAQRLCFILISAIGYGSISCASAGEAILKIFRLLVKQKSTGIAAQLLGALRMSCVDNSFLLQLTTPEWIDCLLEVIRERNDENQSLLAIRLLEEILKSLPLARNWKRFSAIIESLFSILAEFLSPNDLVQFKAAVLTDDTISNANTKVSFPFSTNLTTEPSAINNKQKRRQTSKRRTKTETSTVETLANPFTVSTEPPKFNLSFEPQQTSSSSMETETPGPFSTQNQFTLDTSKPFTFAGTDSAPNPFFLPPNTSTKPKESSKTKGSATSKENTNNPFDFSHTGANTSSVPFSFGKAPHSSFTSNVNPFCFSESNAAKKRKTNASPEPLLICSFNIPEVEKTQPFSFSSSNKPSTVSNTMNFSFPAPTSSTSDVNVIKQAKNPIPFRIIMANEIIELLRALQSTGLWNTFVSSYLRKSFEISVKPKFTDKTSEKLYEDETLNKLKYAVISFIGGIVPVLRVGSLVRYSNGLGTVQSCSITTCKVCSSTFIETFEEASALVATERETFNGNSLSKQIIRSVGSQVIPISNQLDNDQQRFSLACTKALWKIIQTEKGKTKIISICNDSDVIIHLLVDLASLQTQLEQNWTLEDIERTLINAENNLSTQPIAKSFLNTSTFHSYFKSSDNQTEKSSQIQFTFKETDPWDPERLSDFIAVNSVTPLFTANQTNKQQTANITEKFENTFLLQSTNEQAKAIFKLRITLQILIAREILYVLASYGDPSWRIRDETYLCRVIEIVQNPVYLTRLSSNSLEKLFHSLSTLDECVAQQKVEERVLFLLGKCFEANNSASALFSNGISFDSLVPWITEASYYFKSPTWYKQFINILCAMSISKSFRNDERITATSLLAQTCTHIYYTSNSSENSSSVLKYFSEPLAKKFLIELPSVLQKQRSFEVSASNMNNFSTYLQGLISVAFTVREKLKIAGQHFWLQNFFVVLQCAEAFYYGKNVPYSSIKISSKSSETTIANASDNKRWNAELDENLLLWDESKPDGEPEHDFGTMVIGWGSSDDGQLGKQREEEILAPKILSNLLAPKLISTIIEVSCGNNCTFLRTHSGKVYGFGCGSDARLGLGDKNDRNVPIALDFKGKSISCVRASLGRFAIALDNEGNLWSWGSSEYGALGHGTNKTEILSPSLISQFGSTSKTQRNILQIVCGVKHCVAITVDDDLFTWGKFDFKHISYTPIPIQVNDYVTMVSCGDCFTILGNTRSLWISDRSGSAQTQFSGSQKFTERLEIPPKNDVYTIIQIESFGTVSVLTTQSGKLLLYYNEKFVDTVTLPDFVITKSYISFNHIMAITKNQKLFTAKYGAGKTLQVSKFQEISLPERFPGFESISLGSNHSVAIGFTSEERSVVAMPAEFQLLEKFSYEELLERLNILNEYSQRLISHIEKLPLDSQIVSMHKIDFTMNRVNRDEKLRLLLKHAPPSNSGANSEPSIKVRLNRIGSEENLLFSQVCEQLQDVSVKKLCSERAWKVEFIGEQSIDAGGPFHDSISQICSELQCGKLAILKPTKNNLNNVGKFQESIFPVAECSNEQHFEFLGKLIGISICNQMPLSLYFPHCFWKLLRGDKLVVDDLEEIDELFVRSHRFLIESADEAFSEFSCSDTFPPITIGSKLITLSYSNRESYVKAVFDKQLTAWDKIIKEIRAGVSQFFPDYLLRLFSPKELDVLVCGTPKVDWNLLKEHTTYSDYSAENPIVKWLWEILRSLSVEDSCLFLRFVWGKSRLPHKGNFTSTLRVGTLAGGDQVLPTASTCFFHLSIPKYSSKEIMEWRLLYAIQNCASIDLDRNTPHFGGESDSDSDEECPCCCGGHMHYAPYSYDEEDYYSSSDDDSSDYF